MTYNQLYVVYQFTPSKRNVFRTLLTRKQILALQLHDIALITTLNQPALAFGDMNEPKRNQSSKS